MSGGARFPGEEQGPRLSGLFDQMRGAQGRGRGGAPQMMGGVSFEELAQLIQAQMQRA